MVRDLSYSTCGAPKEVPWTSSEDDSWLSQNQWPQSGSWKLQIIFWLRLHNFFNISRKFILIDFIFSYKCSMFFARIRQARMDVMCPFPDHTFVFTLTLDSYIIYLLVLWFMLRLVGFGTFEIGTAKENKSVTKSLSDSVIIFYFLIKFSNKNTLLCPSTLTLGRNVTQYTQPCLQSLKGSYVGSLR